MVLGRRFPKMFDFTDMDIQRLFPPMEKLVVESIKESGYMHIQATKPDTVGMDPDDMRLCPLVLLLATLSSENKELVPDAILCIADSASP